MQPIKVFFVTYGGGHADIVCRLLDEAKNEPSIECQVLALTTAGKTMDKLGHEYKHCADYLFMDDYNGAFQIGKQLSADIWDSSIGIAYEESCAYLGISMTDLIFKLGEDLAKKEYNKKGRSCFCPVRFLTSVLNLEKPDIVVTTCNVRMEKAAIIAARRLGIKSILIEDLFGYSLLGERSIQVNDLIVPENEVPDTIIVLNQAVKERFLSAGVENERVKSFGQPVFSDWIEIFSKSLINEDLRELKKNNVPVITYIATSRRDLLYGHVEAFIRLAELRKDWHFIIKLHPSSSFIEFECNIKCKLNNVSIFKDENIISLLKGSDLVVQFQSTVGLLCAFCHIPFIELDTTEEEEVLPYGSSGVALVVNNYEQLENSILNLLFKEKKRLNIKNKAEFFVNPTNSAQKIIEYFANSFTE